MLSCDMTEKTPSTKLIKAWLRGGKVRGGGGGGALMERNPTKIKETAMTFNK